MADLNKYLNQDLTTNDMSHSNGMGTLAGGGGAGGLSIERRRALLNRSRVVAAYHHSRLGRQGTSIMARAADQQTRRYYDASSDSFTDSATYENRQRGGMKQRNRIDTKSVERRQHFVEPSARKYDKFS